MLYQDVGQQLYLGGYKNRDTLRVELVGDNSERVRTLLSKALGGDSHWDLIRAIRDFFEETGQTMLLCGATQYEIVYGTNPDDPDEKAFRLAQIPPCTCVTRSGKPYQYVPAGVVGDKSAWLELDPETLVDFTFGKATWSNLDRALETLVLLARSSQAAMGLMTDSHETGVAFDASLHNTFIDHAVARATRPFGWDARQSLSFDWPEPLLLTRALRFRRFTIEMRDRIHDTLNDALRRIGESLGIAVRLTFAGLPSVEDIDAALEDVATGARPYGELWEISRRQ